MKFCRLPKNGVWRTENVKVAFGNTGAVHRIASCRIARMVIDVAVIAEMSPSEASSSRNSPGSIVAAARQSLADPDWWLKARLGRGAEVRRCHYTNYCEALDQQHKAVTCKLWDRLALDEPGVPLDASGRRRLVAPAWR